MKVRYRQVLVVPLIAFAMSLAVGVARGSAVPSSATSFDERTDGGQALPPASGSADLTLGDLLTELSADRDVPIFVSPQLSEDAVPGELGDAEWEAAIESLLAQYNYLAIIDRSGRYRKLWITARRAQPRSKRAADDHAASSAAQDAAGVREPGSIAELPIPLWQPVDRGDPTLPLAEDVPFESVQMDPEFFESLQVGQPLEIPVPQETQPYFGVVSESHNQLNGSVRVWSGPIDGSHDTASFTMTRGRFSTYVTIATGRSIYEVTIDNASGVGSVVDEIDLTKGKEEQDSITPDGAELRGEESVL